MRLLAHRTRATEADSKPSVGLSSVEIGIVNRARQSELRHHQRLHRFGFVFEDGGMRCGIHASMGQPMRQLVHQSQQLLFRIEARAQGDEVTRHPAVHRLGQGGAYQARAAALDVGFQGPDVMKDRYHRSIPYGCRAHHALKGRRPVDLDLLSDFCIANKY